MKIIIVGNPCPKCGEQMIGNHCTKCFVEKVREQMDELLTLDKKEVGK